MKYLVLVVAVIVPFLQQSTFFSVNENIFHSEIRSTEEFKSREFKKTGIVNGRFIKVSYEEFEYLEPYNHYMYYLNYVIFGLWFLAVIVTLNWLYKLFTYIQQKKLFILENIVLIKRVSILFSVLILLPYFMDLLLYIFFSAGIDSNPFYTAKSVSMSYTLSPYHLFHLLLVGLLFTLYSFSVVARDMYEDSKYTI